MTKISVLIVVYNPDDEFVSCLESLAITSDSYSLEIIVVDNASSNGFVENIQADFPQVQFIKSDKNLGFGGGNNLAFESSSGDYIICMNPDVVMNEKALTQLFETIHSDPSIGIVGPKTVDETGELIYTARADHTVTRLSAKYLGIEKLIPAIVYGDYPQKMQSASSPFEADWLTGSCLLMRRETYATIGGFDDGFFLYLEDTDICKRVEQLGLKILFVPQAIVSHVGGTTTARFPTIRVKSYHHSPIHYHRKQGHHMGVFWLKIVFTIELCIKIMSRWLFDLIKPNEARKKHRQAEMQVLAELWSY